MKSLTYTSLASLDLVAADVEAIHCTARDLNALDGVTGLLVFNGTHFLQVIEGAEQTIDQLVERLRRDPRHSGFEIRDERTIAERSFPQWSMELVRVRASYFHARETLEAHLPPTIPADVRQRIARMTEVISTVEMG